MSEERVLAKEGDKDPVRKKHSIDTHKLLYYMRRPAKEVVREQREKFKAEKFRKSRYNLSDYGGFKPSSSPDMIFQSSCGLDRKTFKTPASSLAPNSPRK